MGNSHLTWWTARVGKIREVKLWLPLFGPWLAKVMLSSFELFPGIFWYMSRFVQDNFGRFSLKGFLVASTGMAASYLLFLVKPFLEILRDASWGAHLRQRWLLGHLFMFEEVGLSLSCRKDCLLECSHVAYWWFRESWHLCAQSSLSERVLNETDVFFIMTRSFLHLLVYKASYFLKTKVGFERVKIMTYRNEKNKRLLCIFVHVFY